MKECYVCVCPFVYVRGCVCGLGRQIEKEPIVLCPCWRRPWEIIKRCRLSSRKVKNETETQTVKDFTEKF